jgi:hypothetical protein
MNDITLELATYYEPRIRSAAVATGCKTLFEDADRLLTFIRSALGTPAPPEEDSASDVPVCWPC